MLNDLTDRLNNFNKRLDNLSEPGKKACGCVVLALIAVVVLLVGAWIGNTEWGLWHMAVDKGDMASYENYLERRPEGPHANEAKTRIQTLLKVTEVVRAHWTEWHDYKGTCVESSSCTPAMPVICEKIDDKADKDNLKVSFAGKDLHCPVALDLDHIKTWIVVMQGSSPYLTYLIVTWPSLEVCKNETIAPKVTWRDPAEGRLRIPSNTPRKMTESRQPDWKKCWQNIDEFLAARTVPPEKP